MVGLPPKPPTTQVKGVGARSHARSKEPAFYDRLRSIVYSIAQARSQVAVARMEQVWNAGKDETQGKTRDQ